MTVEEFREYARIDDDETDSTLEFYISAGLSFVESAVGEYNDEKEKEKLLALSAAAFLYDNRQMYVTQAARRRLNAMYNSLILQCQLEMDEV